MSAGSLTPVKSRLIRPLILAGVSTTCAVSAVPAQAAPPGSQPRPHGVSHSHPATRPSPTQAATRSAERPQRTREPIRARRQSWLSYPSQGIVRVTPRVADTHERATATS